MPVPAPQAHDNQAIVVVVIFVAALCVKYWTVVLRMILIVLIGLAVLGLYAGLHDMRHFG
jgi:hypothetical protein